MRIEILLDQRKTAIVKKWFDQVIETYPADTYRFLKKEKDPFANPVGQTVLRGLEAIFDTLLKGPDTDTISSFLDPIIRIRAVQNFTPSKSVSFIYFLKKIIRDNLAKDMGKDPALAAELLALETTVDDLALIAFDIYMECREKIYELKTHQEKAGIYAAFKRAGLVCEIPEVQSDGN
jgi:hypothetical protein